MSSLSNKQIILGVTGGIAAYKSAEVVRRLQDQGADVRVVMTPAASEFIRPLTMQALSGHPVHSDLLDSEAEAGMGHIELARWADLLLIAPASADFIANMVHGKADSLLGAIHLATPAKVAVAPAMNQAMWSHPASLANIEALQQRGVTIIGPDQGIQACGDIGPGRMEQPDSIVRGAGSLFQNGLLAGKKIVLTAGPTREALDPVRYLSNHSSGKMGFALARAAAEAGALVTLITGPVVLSTPMNVERIDVVSADDMLEAAQLHGAGCDIFVGAAAVADYRPATVSGQKIKKSEDRIVFDLMKNPDVIATMAVMEQRPTLVIGFAAETEKMLEHARGKLLKKSLDFVIANDVSRSDIGFNSDLNCVSVIDHTSCTELPLANKSVLAKRLFDMLASRLS